MQLHTSIVFCVTCVELPIVYVASVAVCQNICFDPPFGGLLKEESKPPLEANHCFVNGDLLVQGVGSFEIVQQRCKKWTQFVQGIMTWLPSWDVLAVVIQV